MDLVNSGTTSSLMYVDCIMITSTEPQAMTQVNIQENVISVGHLSASSICTSIMVNNEAKQELSFPCYVLGVVTITAGGQIIQTRRLLPQLNKIFFVLPPSLGLAPTL